MGHGEGAVRLPELSFPRLSPRVCWVRFLHAAVCGIRFPALTWEVPPTSQTDSSSRVFSQVTVRYIAV